MRSATVPLLLLFLFGAGGGLGAEPAAVVQSGHVGSVNALAYKGANRLLFTGGADGTVRVWTTRSNALVRVLQAGHLSIHLIAANPARSEVAVFETDNIGVFRIAVWDWSSERLLFTRDLPEAPLFLTYSPGGRFLVYGVTDWRSLYFIDATDGHVLPYFAQGFGIVSGVVISDSERSILTYSPAGRIDYWTIDNGALKQSIQTVPNLTALSFTGNAIYMIGTDGAQLEVVNLLTGQLTASAPAPGIQLTAINPDTGAITCYSTDAGGAELTLWSLSSGALYEQNGALLTPDQHVTDLVFADGSVFASLDDGTLYAERPYANSAIFGTTPLAQIDDVAYARGTLLLATDNQLYLLRSDFLTLDDPTATSTVGLSAAPNPLRAATGVAAIGDRFALWRNDSVAEGFFLLSPGGSPASPAYLPQAGILDIAPAGPNIAVLDAAGQCSLVDPDTGIQVFHYGSFGIKSVLAVDGGRRIIAGQSMSPTLNTSLLQINTTTGETVPLPSTESLVFDMAYNSASATLYTLGIDNRGGTINTVLRGHDMSTLTAGDPLLTFGGVDLGATLAIDPQNGQLYTSLGFDAVRKLGTNGIPAATTFLERSNHIPRKVIVGSGWILAMNSDSTMTVWDKGTSRRLLDFYVFKDGEWIALLPSGEYLGSAGAERYVRIFDDDGTESLNTGQFRLDLQTAGGN